MRVITTAILGVLVIVLGVVIRTVDHVPVSGADAASTANVLVRFPIEAVEKVSIERGPARVEVLRRGEQWFFSEPETDRVDAAAMAKLLDELNYLTRIDEIDSDENLSATQLGLEGDEAIRVVISGKNEAGDKINESLILGTEAPRANSIYVKRHGSDEVYVVDGNPRPWISAPLQTLRDPRILSVPVEAVVQLAIRRPDQSFALQRRITPPQQDWILTSPLQAWAGLEEMDQLMADLAALKIAEVRQDQDLSEKIPEPLPEKSVVIQMQVFGVEQPLTLFLKEVEAPPVEGAPAMVEVRISDRPYVYRIQSRILESLPEEANDLRSRTLAKIPGNYLDTIVIEHVIDPTVLLKSERSENGLRWDVRIANKLLPANQGEVLRMVNGVNEARILTFAADNAEDLESFGLDRPERRVTFSMKFPGQQQADGSISPVQEMTRVLRLGWGKGEQRNLYAHFEGDPYVFEVDPSLLNLIPTHPIKWRSLTVLSFSAFSLRSITREVPGREQLKLAYRYQTDRWEAFRNGADVSATLNEASARRLGERLGDLKARGWYLSLAQAYEALQEPDAEFTVVTSQLDPAIGEAVDKTYKIRFAKSGIVVPPSSEPLYFGKLEDSPDVFFVDPETFGNLIRPVTTSRALK